MFSFNDRQVQYAVVTGAFFLIAAVTAIGPTNIASSAMSYISDFTQQKSSEYLVQTWVTSPDGVRRLESEYYANSQEAILPPDSALYDSGPGKYEVQVSVENAGVKQWSEPFSITIR